MNSVQHSMDSQSMLDELDRYYSEQGISALGFNCKHREACGKMCARDQMISVPESYVGPEYEKGTLPRLLFVSSDTNRPNWLKERPEYGTLRCGREIMLRDMRDIRDGRKKWKRRGHWYKTIFLAKAILAPFSKGVLNRIMNMPEIVEYVAHTRSTRCKDESIGTKEGNPLMSVNCREFLKGEIEIMRPDIIVTQGERAGNALAGAFRPVPSGRVDMPGHPRHNAFYEMVKISETHTAIKCVAWHPCAHWRRGEEEQFMDWAAKIVQEVIPPAEWTKNHNVPPTAPHG